MEQALRNRLTYGPLMIAALLAMLYLDWWLEKTIHIGNIKPRGVGILILLLLILPPAVYELANLFAAERVKPYRSIASLGCAALVIHAFLTQFTWFEPIATSTLAFIIVFVMLFAALRRAFMRQTQDAIHHMAGTVLATLYLGGLAWFLMALRVKHAGLVQLQRLQDKVVINYGVDEANKIVYVKACRPVLDHPLAAP